MKRTSFRAQSFQRSLRAQGTIEYLVVIAVVIVLALVVIGLLTSLSSPAGAVVKSSSELKNKLGVGGLNVVDVVAGSNEDGLLVLQNVSSDPLTVYKVSIDGADHNFCDLIAAGSQLSLKLDNINACNGSNKNYTVKVYFNSAANLPNSADFATMTVDCVTGEVTPAGSFAEENSSNGCGRPTKYTVSFDSQGGSLISPISGIISGATIALPLAPTKTGYVFSGWYTGTNGSGSSFTGSTIISGNVTIYANWVAAVYVVTYDNQGADVNASPSSQTVTFPASSVGLLPTAPTKTGYIFGGWYTGINGNGSSFIGSTPVSSSIFVYANWLAYSYTVYFDSQGADINASPVTKSVVSPATTVGSLPTAPTKTNYIFGGWYTQISGGGTAFTGSTTVLGDLNVYAKWTFVSPPVLLLDLRFDTNATYVPGSGYLTHDLSGNGNDGNVVNSVWLPTGGHDGNGDYNVTGGYIDLGSKASLENLDKMTISIWAKPSFLWGGSTGNRIMCSQPWGWSVGRWCLYFWTGYDIQWAVVSTNGSAAGTYAQGTIFDTNQWYHIVGVYDGNYVTMYVNGVPSSPAGLTGIVAATTYRTIIGYPSYLSNDRYDGLVDDVKIYRGSFTASQVLAIP